MLSPNPIINFFLQILTLRGSFDWAGVWKYLFSPFIIQGVIITIMVSVLAQLFGTVLGLLLYFMRRSRLRVARVLANTYIWIFRGTPVYVQILLLYTLLAYIALSRPLKSLDWFTPLGFHNVYMDSVLAAIVALALNEGAYMAEIVRAGIDSIDVGQMEAAKSLGMTYWLGMRRIVLPQALRVIVPPLGNEFNNMLKTSSLASAISLPETLGISMAIASSTFLSLELLVVASMWYLAMTTIWTLVQVWIERKLGASTREPTTSGGGSWWKRAIGFGRPATAGIPAAIAGEPTAELPIEHR